MVQYDDYKLRIINASALELTIITFELLIKNMENAIINFEDNSEFEFDLKKSKKFLRELILALNMKEKISHELFDLYNYVNKILILQSFNKNKEELTSAIEIITNIKEGFDGIKDLSGTPLMENTDNVYAGLTYKNGQLSEYVNPTNKGFKA